MRKWRIHKENGRYIPQKKWFFFWIDIYCYRLEFESIKDAIYCIKKYDEYYKKKEDEEKIEDYYLDEKYEVK